MRQKRAGGVGAGPCAKQVVTATLKSAKGNHYVATNDCMTPQPTCARDGMATGEGYELCASVCQQTGHAEANAIKLAGKFAKGGTLYVDGHSYACESCKAIAREAGVVAIVIGKPPGNAPDGPRYKALGNSMAVPCMAWIGRRIQQVSEQ
jgi:deoxycytidylate deaminase